MMRSQIRSDPSHLDVYEFFSQRIGFKSIFSDLYPDLQNGRNVIRVCSMVGSISVLFLRVWSESNFSMRLNPDLAFLLRVRTVNCFFLLEGSSPDRVNLWPDSELWSCVGFGLTAHKRQRTFHVNLGCCRYGSGSFYPSDPFQWKLHTTSRFCSCWY